MSIYVHSEPQLVSEFVLQVSVRELDNIITSPPEEGELKDARVVDNNIIISDSTLRSIITLRLRRFLRGTRSYVFVSAAYIPKLFIHHYYHGVIVFE